MPLSCTCRDYDDCEWYYYVPEDFSFLETKRSRRCSSCKSKIKPKSGCIRFDRFRYAKDEIEEKIRGEGSEIYMAPWFMCERCGEQFLNLRALGYCIEPSENMMELLKEYRQLHAVEVTNDHQD